MNIPTEPIGSIPRTPALVARLEENEVVVSVKDEGVGVPPDRLENIFEMFSQVDNSLERTRGGLGIGLTLVRELVELHHGTVEAHSAGLDQGSEFVVRLPGVVEAREQPQKSEPETQIPPTTSARRILVVDDNRDAAESLSMLLRLCGNETHIANDGLEAVEAAAAFQPDVILMDIGLPKLNGYEATRKIRQQPIGKNLVIVALTGWGKDEDRQRSADAGFDQHLVKPVDHEVLLKLLSEIPGKKQ